MHYTPNKAKCDNRIAPIVAFGRDDATFGSVHYTPNKAKSDNRIAPIVAFGRDEATRTPDPYVPNVVRYQLRYIPIVFKRRLQRYIIFLKLVHYLLKIFGCAFEKR